MTGRLESFSVDELVPLARRIREEDDRHDSMADAAQAIAELLHGELLVDVLVYKTHLERVLPMDLACAAADADDAIGPDTPCLVLLGRAGEAGDDGGLVPGDEAILPLTPRALVDLPLFPRVITGLGLDLQLALDPRQMIATASHLENLEVVRLAGRVVLGGAVPSGDLFLVVLGSDDAVDDDVAALLKTLAVAVKAALIPYTFKPFAASESARQGG